MKEIKTLEELASSEEYAKIEAEIDRVSSLLFRYAKPKQIAFRSVVEFNTKTQELFLCIKPTGVEPLRKEGIDAVLTEYVFESQTELTFEVVETIERVTGAPHIVQYSFRIQIRPLIYER